MKKMCCDFVSLFEVLRIDVESLFSLLSGDVVKFYFGMLAFQKDLKLR